LKYLVELNTSNPNKWNYNEKINKPGLDPYNNKKTLDTVSYNLMKFNTVIMSLSLLLLLLLHSL
jgi:hypothetical protein